MAVLVVEDGLMWVLLSDSIVIFEEHSIITQLCYLFFAKTLYLEFVTPSLFLFLFLRKTKMFGVG